MPTDADAFWGDSSSADFQAWRAELGHIDLVFIDGNHTHAECRDFAINGPSRTDSWHSTTSRVQTDGRRGEEVWDELDTGHKWEIVGPAELGAAHSVMGIGIWSAVGGGHSLHITLIDPKDYRALRLETLGLMYIAAVLQEAGHGVRIVATGALIRPQHRRDRHRFGGHHRHIRTVWQRGCHAGDHSDVAAGPARGARRSPSHGVHRAVPAGGV